MERIEYRTMDKSGWVAGPWQDEPDKIQYPDPETGLPCMIRRSTMGFLCGYVGVPKGHPWYGQHYGDLPVDVHGGLTFSDVCSGGPEESSICHVPGEGEPDHVWWLGFDCGHLHDATYMNVPEEIRWRDDGTYRDVRYVEAQNRALAEQVEAAGATTPAPTA